MQLMKRFARFVGLRVFICMRMLFVGLINVVDIFE